MTPSVSITGLLQTVRQNGWALVRDFPPLNREELLQYVRGASTDGSDPCLHWGFGPIMDLKEDDHAQNYLFTREGVPFHWDGVFFHVPSVLVFQCVQAPRPGAGGQTLFAHAEKLYTALTPEQRGRWGNAQITYTTEKLAHYGGQVTLPLFDRHPTKGTPVVRFAEPVTTKKNPVTIAISGVAKSMAEEIQAHFTLALYDDKFCYTHEWREGDLLLADNHALMHGRRAFVEGSPRHIRRIQLK